MRIALHSRLRPGHVEAYLREHRTIFADLAQTFARVGIHDWTIWRSGLDLFHLVECDDYEAAVAALADDPAGRRWQEFIGVHVERFVLSDDGEQPLAPVWRLADQEAGLIDVVDAHHHVWERDRLPQPWIDPVTMAAIDRDFPIVDLPAARLGVGATVAVQTADSWAETADLLALAASPAGREAGLAGVVGWADLGAPDLAERLAALRAGPGGAQLVGVRTMLQADPDPDAPARAEVRDGVGLLGAAGLTFDLVIRADQLPAAARLADAVGTTLVLDHLGKPALTPGADLGRWRRDLAALAERPNVAAKLSGLVTEADHDSWTVADLRPAVEHALATFGPERLMFGSDWPVCLLASTYRRWRSALGELIAHLPPAQRAAIWSGTARRVYGLPAVQSR